MEEDQQSYQGQNPGALMWVEREVNGEILECTEEEALIENIMDVKRD